MALILVMLALLILTVLSAGIVFTARSETLASNSFRMNTQADYLAKAGIQQTVNWFRSTHYLGVPESTPPTNFYNVQNAGAPYYLYTANAEPVLCTATSPSCAYQNCPVQLIGYASSNPPVSVSGCPTNVSNYPNLYNNESTSRLVANAFAGDLVNVRVTGNSGNSGTFSINAYLLSYQTLNVGATPPYTRVPAETWLVTSRALWTGSSSSNAIIGTAEEQMEIQPIYEPNWGMAMYAYCDITMSGSQGTCVDAFNSSLGQYAGGNISVASGNCDQISYNNVINSGATIGANGGITLGSNITVAGNVIIGSNPSAGCVVPNPPFGGTPSQVINGQVLNGTSVPQGPIPTFPAGFPGNAPTYNNSVVLPVGSAWPAMPPWPGPLPSLGSQPCSTSPATTCNGTTANPYEITSISVTANNKTVQLIGGPDVFHPVVYDIGSITLGGNTAEIDVSGYVVLNVQGSIDIAGNGITNGIAGTVDIPPAAVSINAACSGNCINIHGNGAVSALINAPLANVTFGGGGANGYFVGAVQANNISVQGGYSMHYDVQLGGRNLGGTLSAPLVTAYSRKKM